MLTKSKKLEKLGITTSSNQAPLVPLLKVVPPQGNPSRCVNVRFINHTHKVVQNVTRAQHNAIQALKTNRNIVIKLSDKGGAVVIQNRTDYCREVYRQLNNQEHYRRLPADLTKEHTCQLNRLIKTFDPDLQSALCTLIPCT
eukprot:g26196.t1